MTQMTKTITSCASSTYDGTVVVRYNKSGVNTENAVQRIKKPPFMIVHHMKKVVRV